MKCNAIFFDRDGVVNVRLIDKYVLNISQFEFISGFFSLFEQIKKLGFLAILITNQQGIGKGLMTEQALDSIHNYMQSELILNTGFCFDDIFFCSELKETNSFRRKPNPGMIIEAIEKYNINVTKSYFIGDSYSDIIAGNSTGLTTIYLNDNICNFANYNFNNINEISNFFNNTEIINA